MRLDFKLLGKKNRMRGRGIAIEVYSHRHPWSWANMDRSEIVERVRESVKRDRVFGSVIMSVLLPIIIKLIVDLIVDWATKGVRSPSEEFVMGEPGYE